MATEAARRKKDIYSEKPLAHTVAEQPSIVRAVKQNGIIWQMGSWQRSMPTFHKAAETVHNGFIGTVTHVKVRLPGGNSDFDNVQKDALTKLAGAGVSARNLMEVVPGSKAWDLLVTDPPEELDYEMWVGPSKMEPYIRARSHKSWRWNYNTASNHQQNFLDCIRTRQPTITTVEVGQHSAIPGHLCLVSMVTGKKIRWDAKEEKIVGDSAASNQLTREFRGPWKMS